MNGIHTFVHYVLMIPCFIGGMMLLDNPLTSIAIITTAIAAMVINLLIETK